ncbi:MAG: amino acid permease [Robiginitomaculum sp.]
MGELKKSLTTLTGAGLMLNIVIGAGLLSLPGLAVKMVGDHAIFSWIICALASIPLLLVFVFMGRRYPNAGGVSHFSRMAFGNNIYSATSFIFLGAIIFGLPSIALTGGHYLSRIIPISPTLIAGMLIILSAFINLLATKTASKFSTIVASAVLIVLTALALLGLFSIDWDVASSNFIPPKNLNINIAMAPFMMLFFAFTGWEVAAGISEEFKNPKRDFPRAMFLSFFAACTLYFLMAVVVQSISISDSYESSFATITSIKLGVNGELITSVVAGIIILANLMAAIWAISRMVYSLSRENIIPISLKVHKNGSPISSVCLTSATLLLVLMLQWLGFFNFEYMLSIAGQNFLILYGVASLSLLKISSSIIDKLVSIISIIIVVSLLYLQGLALYYPLSLAIIGIIVGYIQRGKLEPKPPL